MSQAVANTDNNSQLSSSSEFDENLENFRFVIRTVQASAFRTLIEALKEILTDVNIEIDSSGMKIIAMDTSHVALIHMKLLAKNFEKYYCPKPVVCGISMMRVKCVYLGMKRKHIERENCQ